MEMVPVESSNVAAVGFEAELMRVQFLDGAIYEYPATVEQHAAMMLAKSKGKYLAQHFRKTGSRVDAPTSKPERVWSRTLQGHEPDECCGEAIARALLSGKLDEAEEWTHEKCGMSWKAHTLAGQRHWIPDCPIEVLR